MANVASKGGRLPKQGKTGEAVADAEFEQWPEDVDFGPLADLVGYALRRAQIAIYRDFFATVDELGFTPQLFAALVLIERNPGLNQTRLGRIMGVNRAAAMALIDRLQDMELVMREASKTDRRSNAVALTKLGRSHLALLIQAVQEHDARASRNLTSAEVSTLRRLLAKF